jgi:simple sugar transport system permease protein
MLRLQVVGAVIKMMTTALRSRKSLYFFVVVIAIAFAYSVNSVSTVAVAASSITFGLPLAMAAMVGIMCERTGVVNIGIEGTLLTSAFFGFFVAALSQNLIWGLLAAIASGAVTGLLLALLTVSWKMDQIIAGTIVNILATGLTSFFYKQGYSLPAIFPRWSIPGLSDIPFLGRVFFQSGPITYFGLILIFALYVAMYHTPWGLRTRAIGEYPSSAETSGVSVKKFKYINVVIAGAFGGLTGAYLTLELVGSFDRGFSAGKGFTALAIMIFGRWNPIGALLAAIFFGFAQALANQLMIDGLVAIPGPFINMLPYVLTIVVLAVSAGKVRGPAAAGQPYEREQA